jgi:hypothetical protein
MLEIWLVLLPVWEQNIYVNYLASNCKLEPRNPMPIPIRCVQVLVVLTRTYSPNLQILC